VRIIAMMRRILIAIAIIGAVLIAGIVLFPEKPQTPLPAAADRVLIEKSEHRMSLFKNGQVLRAYRFPSAAAGRRRSPAKATRVCRREPIPSTAAFRQQF
jgi:hypothetical protein